MTMRRNDLAPVDRIRRDVFAGRREESLSETPRAGGGGDIPA